jgi:predicted amidohydrolase
VARLASIALAQVTGWPYAPERNREQCATFVREAFRRGADLVLLPELIVPGYVADPELLVPIAEPIDGPSVEEWCALAAAADGYVVGGFCEREGDELYNTAVLVDGEGVVLHYRKLHPFAAEKHAFAPGDLGLPVAETEIGTVGLCVCYDLRFVETLRILALRGAELVCVPTAWVSGFDREKWDRDGMAPQAHGAILQANLDQVFVACASQAGTRGELELLGSSILVDPRGELVAGPLSGTDDELAVAEIDLEAAREAQERNALITPRADRRTDVYGVAVGGDVL